MDVDSPSGKEEFTKVGKKTNEESRKQLDGGKIGRSVSHVNDQAAENEQGTVQEAETVNDSFRVLFARQSKLC